MRSPPTSKKPSPTSVPLDLSADGDVVQSHRSTTEINATRPSRQTPATAVPGSPEVPSCPSTPEAPGLPIGGLVESAVATVAATAADPGEA